MSNIISVYTKKHFHEFLLPALHDENYEVPLFKRSFGLAEDIILRFETVNEVWNICPGEGYRIFQGQEITAPYTLKSGQVIQVQTAAKERITLMNREEENVFHPFEKISLTGLNSITIGRNAENLIQYDNQGMVSGKHAELVRQGAGWIIRNYGGNGLYRNDEWITGEATLEFGDHVNIIGLHLLFLGDHIAVDSAGDHIRMDRKHLRTMPFQTQGSGAAPAGTDQIAADRSIFHRSPRRMEEIVETPIEVEAPPNPVKSKEKPVLLTIGPSFTMAIPMLMGCLLMIYASRVSGTNMGLFMYSGLVMAVSSACIGVMWAVLNMRYQKKEEEEEEAKRFDAYSRYLVEKTEEIRKIYESNSEALHHMYPEASVCAGYNESSVALWNRNPAHADFLSCRLGLGDIPFQAEIQVPKKKFTLVEDALGEKPYDIEQHYKTLYQVPVLLDLLRHPLIGLTGGAEKQGAIETARLLSLQIAATHCYTDVKLVFLFDGAASEDAGKWTFAKWLPHTWSEDRKIRYVASDRSQISDVCYELTKIFRQRKEEQESAGKGQRRKPHFVVFLSDASLVEGELLAKYIFDADENMGLTTLILAGTPEELPNACSDIVQRDLSFEGIASGDGAASGRTAVVFDTLRPEQLDAFARGISGLEVQEIETGGEIPSSLTFFEMYGVNHPEELNARERWLKNRTYDNIRGLIGQKAGGAPCVMDVHEKYHGPHGLVAGTTGSGKSETLQTYMLSLALNYSPDDIGFFIIDYKGGGMANLFDRLPHLVGQISNLSGNQVHRAMVSIKSENRRRQRIFSENGVNNINAYTRLVKNKEAAEPVPHLFIIIDEFAELKKEEPDFMRELISVAQVGRSLGVHLILATQKPSGTVDDNIWSNSKFRLCLRVQDREDSMDMLHKPDAAYITQAGRCYLQVGSDEVYELFQSGWSGAPYDALAQAGTLETARLLTLSGRTDAVGSHARSALRQKGRRQWLRDILSCIHEACSRAGIAVQDAALDPEQMHALTETVYAVLSEKEMEYPQSRYNTDALQNLIRLFVEVASAQKGRTAHRILREAQKRGIRLPEQKERTQLDAVIDYLAHTAAENGYTKGHRLWLPLLPERVYLEDFASFRAHAFDGAAWKQEEGDRGASREWNLSTLVGLSDDPGNQAQMPVGHSFSEGGHTAVIGSVVTGKSTLLQTIVYSYMMQYTPQQIQFYGIDFSSRMLSAFEQAPHVGGIVYEGENERIAKLFHLIGQLQENRKTMLRGGTFSQYVQVHGGGLPAVVLVIDNFSAFQEKTGAAYESQILRLSKEGAGHGIFLLISAGGFGMSELPGRIAENMKTVLCLEMPDRYAYADVLHTMRIGTLPETGIKGRGLAFNDGRLLEFQAALALEAEDDYQRIEKIAQKVEQMRGAWTLECAKPIPEIPEKPVWDAFVQLPDVQQALAVPELVPVGYDERSAGVYSINLKDIYCYLITGNARTGKRNFMKILIQSVRSKGAKVCIIDSAQDMAVFRDAEDVVYLENMDAVFTFFMEELTPEFQKRNRVKRELELEGAEEEELFAAAAKEQPVFLFIADLSWFIPQAYLDTRGMSGFLETLIRKGRFHNIYFIGNLPLDKRSETAGYALLGDFASYHTGIHFGGNTAQNNLLNFDYLGYQKQSVVLRPGIGLLPEVNGEHDVERVVVPLAKLRK